MNFIYFKIHKFKMMNEWWFILNADTQILPSVMWLPVQDFKHLCVFRLGSTSWWSIPAVWTRSRSAWTTGTRGEALIKPTVLTPHTTFTVKALCVCSQDQSSGSGASCSGLPGEGGPWHHSLGLRQLQRGSYSLLGISSQTMWWSGFLFFYKIVQTEYKRGVTKIAWGYDYIEATKTGKAVPLRPNIYIMRTVWSPGADSGIIIYLRRRTTGRRNVCLCMRCPTDSNNKTRQWK